MKREMKEKKTTSLMNMNHTSSLATHFWTYWFRFCYDFDQWRSNFKTGEKNYILFEFTHPSNSNGYYSEIIRCYWLVSCNQHISNCCSCFCVEIFFSFGVFMAKSLKFIFTNIGNRRIIIHAYCVTSVEKKKMECHVQYLGS